MKEVNIDYSLLKRMSMDEFVRDVVKQFVFVYKGKLKHKHILEMINAELIANDCKPATLNQVKYYSAKLK